ncbi:MAG: DNA methyltransferase [Thermoprotei archaeon]
MKRVSFEEYLEYIKKNDKVVVEDQVIELKPIKRIRLLPTAEELMDVSTTVWSFPKRGSWATHRGNYRGNWAPQIPRALILMYTKPGDTVLDPMIGSGTTCIEAKLLGRNCIGVDINYDAVILTLHRLYELEKILRNREKLEKYVRELGMDITTDDILSARVEIYYGDARNLDKIASNSIDLIATHPPYLNIIRYGAREKIEGDLSRTSSLEEYLLLFSQVSREMYRVLKPGRYLGILVGDTRIHKHYVPITHYVLQVLLHTGFILKEEVIKIQHKMKTTREVWSKLRERDFLLIYHEKLYIMRKPLENKEYTLYKYSSKQDFLKLDI